MANFEPKQLVANEVNKGEKYRNGVDSPQADAFNRLIEAILYAQENGASVNITIDSELSDTSTNPVQNKVVKEALDGKLDKVAIADMLYGTNSKGEQYMYYARVNPLAFCVPIWNANGCIKTKTPQDDNDATPKKYVDDTKNKVNNKIKGIYSGLVQKEIYAVAEDVETTKEAQKTGGSELDGLTVVDGSIATVKKIQGNTVVYERELKHAQISSIKGIGKNWFNPKFFANAGFTQQSDGAWKGKPNLLYDYYGIKRGGLFGSGLNISEQITISYISKVDLVNPLYDGAIVGFVYTDGTQDSTTAKNTEYEKKTITSRFGKVVDTIYFVYGTIENTTYFKDFQIEIGSTATEYKPYIESVMELPKTIELGKWDYIKNGQFIKATQTMRVNKLSSYSMIYNETYNAYYGVIILNDENYGTQNYGNGNGPFNIISNKFETASIGSDDKGVYLSNVNYNHIMFWFNKDKYPEFSDINKVNEYIASLDLVVAYELATPTVTDLSFDNTYQVWNKGLEQIVSPKINGLNSFNYGANPTIENDYYILVGGAE